MPGCVDLDELHQWSSSHWCLSSDTNYEELRAAFIEPRRLFLCSRVDIEELEVENKHQICRLLNRKYAMWDSFSGVVEETGNGRNLLEISCVSPASSSLEMLHYDVTLQNPLRVVRRKPLLVAQQLTGLVEYLAECASASLASRDVRILIASYIFHVHIA